MKPRIVVLGAGFGGLELASCLSEALADGAEVTLIDQSAAFVFGFAKLDVMFGRATPEEIRHPYAHFAKPGVVLLKETVTAIDPATRTVKTDRGTHHADILVIALGADYDVSSTPGIVLGENEFYSIAGATRLRDTLAGFGGGHVVIGVCHAPYKCPPAPSECALMLHDFLVRRGIRADTTITLAIPLPSPVPPSPDTSRELLSAFAERGIEFRAARALASYDSARRVAVLSDGEELPCDLLLAVPKQRAPEVVVSAGLTEKGWVTIDPRTLETPFAGVYALGDVANTGAPKAGVFAEGAARTVAKNILSRRAGAEPTERNPGAGSCYIEFGGGRVARVDVDFFSGPKPTGTFQAPSPGLRAEKDHFGASRRVRWFGG